MFIPFRVGLDINKLSQLALLADSTGWPAQKGHIKGSEPSTKRISLSNELVIDKHCVILFKFIDSIDRAQKATLVNFYSTRICFP